MRKFDLSLRSSRSSYFATFRHQLTILSKTDAMDEEKWLNIDRKSGSAGMPRPISYAVFCLKKKLMTATQSPSLRPGNIVNRPSQQNVGSMIHTCLTQS